MKLLIRFLAVFLLTLAAATAQNPVPAGNPANGPAPAPSTPAAPAPAAESAPVPAPAAAAQADESKSFLEIVKQGGITMYVLIAVSVVMCALIVFYVLTVRRGAVVSDHFMRTADTLIRKQQYLELLSVCNRRNESIAAITRKALDFATKNPTATFDEVREVTESEGQRQASRLSQRITYLADVGAIAPMIGLLGTVIGIMKEFRHISSKDMLNAQMEFAGGTAMALVNTAGGLGIAIPSMIIYSLYKGRVNSLISEMEAAATHIMALLAAQYKRVTAQARAQQAAAMQAGQQPAARPAR
ncbi:MAG TPA: MotA/TolQ/ExbB proton channel family protein [Verrucomicrobiales bacterium]|nr:MotA/TolQ/ExbB proton channel family protein [Verrucomicrobiales bacterium]